MECASLPLLTSASSLSLSRAQTLGARAHRGGEVVGEVRAGARRLCWWSFLRSITAVTLTLLIILILCFSLCFSDGCQCQGHIFKSDGYYK